jgi:SAM-dependent methyltransferase
LPEGRLRREALARADRLLLRRLAPSYLSAYARAGVWGELVEYLGDEYDPQLLVNSEREVEAEEEDALDEETFYRTSKMYLYDLSAFELSPTKEPYRRAVEQHVPPGGRILDYGCGIGADGIAFIRAGYDVAFADFDNPSTEFLRWRLERRGATAPLYDIDTDDVPSGFDAVICFDVIEHVDDPAAFLDRLESLASVVAVNFLEPDPHDTHLHRPLPIGELVARARRKGLLAYRRHYGRSHLVVYRSDGGGAVASSARFLAGRAHTAWEARRA